MASRVIPFLVVLTAFSTIVIILINYGVTAAAATAMVMTLATGAVTVVLRLTSTRDK